MKKLLLLCCLALPLISFADERILDFKSEIIIRQDGSIVVTETIIVRSEGQKIRRGIYRDFPTRYRDAYGNNVEVSYTPLSVQRNGEPESFRTNSFRNGIRTYFGSANRMLANGVHTYTFRYSANRMLGFFAEHDELYWNVTGSDWAFPIDHASASVTLEFDDDPRIIDANAFTGLMGARGTAFTKQVNATRSHSMLLKCLRRMKG